MSTTAIAAPMISKTTAQIEDATVLSAEIVAMFHDEVREVSHLRAPKPGRTASFSIGGSLGVDFHLDTAELAGRALPLVRAIGTGESGFVLTFLPSFAGEATLQGVTEKLAKLASTGRAMPSSLIPGAFELPLVQGMKVAVVLGDVRFIITGVAAPRRQPVSFFAGFDKRFAKYIAGAAAAAALMLGIMSAVPPQNASVSLDKLSGPKVSAELNMKAEDHAELITEKVTSEGGGEGGKVDPSKGGKAEGPNGKMGNQTSKNQNGKISIMDRGPDKGLAVNEARERGLDGGIVGAMRRRGGFALVVKNGPLLPSDYGDRDVYDGGLEGPYRDQYGWNGRGTDGTGWGGDGDSDRYVGDGNYNTIKKGDGDNDKWKQPGDGKGDPDGKHVVKRPPRTEFGKAETESDIDRATIQREIRKHRSSFEHCYERQLRITDGIEGTVTAQFTILGNGAVRASRASGVHPAVASCVAQVISHIEFPKPSSGGSATVTYPFIFRQAGQ